MKRREFLTGVGAVGVGLAVEPIASLLPESPQPEPALKVVNLRHDEIQLEVKLLPNGEWPPLVLEELPILLRELQQGLGLYRRPRVGFDIIAVQSLPVSALPCFVELPTKLQHGYLYPDLKDA